MDDWQRTVDAVSDLIAILDDRHRIVRVNRAMAERLGKSPEDCVGLPCYGYVHGTDEPPPYCPHSQLLKDGQEHSVEIREEGLGGDFSVSVSPLLDSDGRVTGSVHVARDISDRKRAEERIERLNRLNEDLLGNGSLAEKMKRITDGVVDILGADFARIWLSKPGDMCNAGCMHAMVTDGPHVCHDRRRCLHLVASSGRYTHIDGRTHRRVPFGCYKIGRVAAGNDDAFLTNDVAHDSYVHNQDWAQNLGLVSFAGYRLVSHEGAPIGVLVLFSKHALSPSEESLLKALADTASEVVQVAESVEALRESEERYQLAQRVSGVGTWEWNVAKNEVFWSDEVVAMWGLKPDEFGGTFDEVAARIHPDDIERWRENVRACVEDGREHKIEIRIVWPDGSVHWVAALGDAERDENRSALRMIGVVMDITERVQAVEALAESERYHRSLLHSIHEDIVVLDRDYRITDVNNGASVTTGLDRDQIVGRRCFEVFRGHDEPCDRRGEQCGLRQVFATGEPSNCHHQHFTRDGRKIDVDILMSPLKDTHGNITHAIESMRDVTDLFEAQRALEASEAALSKAEIVAGFGSWDWDLEANKLKFSTGLCRVFGIAPEEFGQNYSSFLEFLPADEVERTKREVDEAIAGVNPLDYEHRIIRPDGQERVIHAKAEVAFDEHGKAARMIGTARDVTKRRQAETLVREQRDLAVALSATTELDAALRLCVETALRSAGMDCSGVYLVDDGSGALDLAYHEGLSASFIKAVAHHDAASDHTRLVMAGEPVYANYNQPPIALTAAEKREGLGAFAVIPIKHEDRVIGCLNVASHVQAEVPRFACHALEAIAAQIGSSITRLKAQETQREREENLRTFFSSVADFLFVLDERGHILHVNPVVPQRLGYAEDELIGRPVLAVHPADRREEATSIVADMVTGKAETCPIPLVTKSGKEIPVETRVATGRWNGQPALFGISRDLTERRRAEAALRESETRFREVFSSMSDGVAIYDVVGDGEDFVFKDINPAGALIGHTPREEHAGRSVLEVYPGVRELGLFDVFREVWRTGQPRRHPVSAYRDDRISLWVENYVCKLPTGEIVAVYDDITEQKRAEEQIRQRIAELAHMGRLSTMGEMATGLAHELNQPLYAISNYASGIVQHLQMATVDSPDLTETMGKIVQQARRASDIIRRLRELTRKCEPRRSTTDMNQLVEDLLALLEHELRLGAVSVERKLAEQLPAVLVDSVQIQQVFVNLIRNALDAMRDVPSNERRLTLSTSAADGGGVEVCVTDTGEGLTSAAHSKLFDAFYTTKADGMGMGLAISRTIVESHGGRLWAEPNSPRGTIFRFALPVPEQ